MNLLSGMQFLAYFAYYIFADREILAIFVNFISVDEFLTCTVPVVEIGFPAILPKLKSSINMILNSRYQSVELFSFEIKAKLIKELNKNFK